MKNNFLLPVFILLIGLMSTSCKNEAADPTVTYEVKTTNEDFEVSYLDENGKNIKKSIKSNYWTESFIGKKGDSASLTIVSNSLNDKVDAKIIYDRKVLKEVVIYGQKSGEYVSSEISTEIPY